MPCSCYLYAYTGTGYASFFLRWYLNLDHGGTRRASTGLLQTTLMSTSSILKTTKQKTSTHLKRRKIARKVKANPKSRLQHLQTLVLIGSRVTVPMRHQKLTTSPIISCRPQIWRHSWTYEATVKCVSPVVFLLEDQWTDGWICSELAILLLVWYSPCRCRGPIRSGSRSCPRDTEEARNCIYGEISLISSSGWILNVILSLMALCRLVGCARHCTQPQEISSTGCTVRRGSNTHMLLIYEIRARYVMILFYLILLSPERYDSVRVLSSTWMDTSRGRGNGNIGRVHR